MMSFLMLARTTGRLARRASHGSMSALCANGRAAAFRRCRRKGGSADAAKPSDARSSRDSEGSRTRGTSRFLDPCESRASGAYRRLYGRPVRSRAAGPPRLRSRAAREGRARSASLRSPAAARPCASADLRVARASIRAAFRFLPRPARLAARAGRCARHSCRSRGWRSA